MAEFLPNTMEFFRVLGDEAVLVVDFTASWCGPCKLISPLIDRLGEEYGDRAKVFKVDLDSNKDLAKQFKITSIPAVMFFKHGEAMETLVGIKPYEDLSAALERCLSV